MATLIGIQLVFAEVVDGKWTSATTVSLATVQNWAIRKRQQGQTLWEEVIRTRNGTNEIKEGQ
eukprot:7902932-Ditylum_brightwellii.AAC.1